MLRTAHRLPSNPSVLLSILFTTLMLLPPASVLAATTVTLSNSSNTPTGGAGSAKVNVVSIAQDAVLTQIEAYYSVSSTQNGTVGVWQRSGTTYTLIWSAPVSFNRTSIGWGVIGTPGVELYAGNVYAIGWHLGSSGSMTYAWNSTATFTSGTWGQLIEWESYSSTAFPSSMSGFSASTAGGYHQRLTLESDPDSDLDGWTVGLGDCDDTNGGVFPGALELCDGLDSNCDGTTPADEQDTDLDGWFPCLGDCDDLEWTTYPGAPENCDGADNNCLGDIDEGLSSDFDGDGFTSIGSCEGTANDCDDSAAAAHPGAVEVCDGLDNDCNLLYDDGLSWDLDNDSFSAPGSCEGTANDCDDTNYDVHPGAAQLCDGVDNPCAGAVPPIELDGDGDAQRPCEGDCVDTDPEIRLGVGEVCGDGVDNNCNSAIDESGDADGDGVGACDDCDDADATTFPGAEEVLCNGEDDDCDGSPLPEELDADADGVRGCEGDCDDTNAAVQPGAEEVCDGADNDCDGAFHPEEGPENDVDQDGVPLCFDCDDADPEVFPGAVEDACDDVDLNCDGVVPDGSECDGDGGGGGGRGRGGCGVAGSGGTGVLALLVLAAAAPRRRRTNPGSER